MSKMPKAQITDLLTQAMTNPTPSPPLPSVPLATGVSMALPNLNVWLLRILQTLGLLGTIFMYPGQDWQRWFGFPTFVIATAALAICREVRDAACD